MVMVRLVRIAWSLPFCSLVRLSCSQMDGAAFLAVGVIVFGMSFAGVRVGVTALRAIAPMSPSATSFKDWMNMVKNSKGLEYDAYVNRNIEEYYIMVGNFRLNLSLTVARNVRVA